MEEKELKTMDEKLKNIELQSKKIEDEAVCAAVGGMEEVDIPIQEIHQQIIGDIPLTQGRDLCKGRELSMPRVISFKDMDDDLGSLLEPHTFTDFKPM